MNGRVILTHGRSLQSLAVAQSLARREIEVIGCDEALFMVLSFSKYVQKTFVLPSSTHVTEQDYINALIEKIKEYKPPVGVPYVLMPVDWETKLFAKYHAQLAPHIAVAAPTWEAIKQVEPKDNLVRTARIHDLHIPNTLLPRSQAELMDNIQQLHFPVFIKVPDASGGNGIHQCANQAELQIAYTQLDQHFHFSAHYQPLVQEAVGDSDYCTTLLAEQGEIKAHITYRNIRAFPANGGAGVWRETIENEALFDTAQDLARKLHWHGIAQIDFRVADNTHTTPWLIEVNPRFFGGLFHSIASGVDYPWLLYRLTLGETLTNTITPEIGVQTRLPLTATLSLFEEAIKQGINYEHLYLSWQKAWNASKEGDLKTAWHAFSQQAQALFSLQMQTDKTLSEKFTELGQAKMEGLSWDDPLTSLGILVILGSLIKNGHLPEEFNTNTKKGFFKDNS